MKVFASFSPALRRNLWILASAGLCFWAGLAGLLPTLPLFIETLGATGQQIGVVMASFAIGLLLARPQLSRLADERGRKLVLMIGMAAIAIAPSESSHKLFRSRLQRPQRQHPARETISSDPGSACSCGLQQALRQR